MHDYILLKEAKDGLEDFLDKAKQSGKNVWKDLMQWLRSFDPVSFT